MMHCWLNYAAVYKVVEMRLDYFDYICYIFDHVWLKLSTCDAAVESELPKNVKKQEEIEIAYTL